MNPVLDGLAKSLLAHHPGASIAELERAYDIAADAHEGQLRKSGHAYITHPLAVSEILAEIGLDLETIIAALLHDTVEDTKYSLTALKKHFALCARLAIMPNRPTQWDFVYSIIFLLVPNMP